MRNLNNKTIQFFDGTTLQQRQLGIKNNVFVAEAFEEKIRINGVVIPPFVDSHSHLLNHLIRKNWFDLSQIKSKKQLLSFLKDLVDQGAKYIVGYNFDESTWPEKQIPTPTELDEISRDIPIMLVRIDGHLAVINSYIIDINRKEFVSGVIKEDKIFSALEELSSTIKMNYTFNAILDYLRLGIIMTADMGSYLLPNGALHRIKEKMEVKLFIMINTIEQYGLTYRTILKKYNAYLGGLKIISDGSIGARTAYLLEPYQDDPNSRGMLLIDESSLERIIDAVIELNIGIAIHAIGDGAIDLVLKHLKKVPTELLPRIEHFEMPLEDHIFIVAKHNIIPSMQPNFIANWQQPGGLYDRRLGWNRAVNMNPLKSIIDKRKIIAFGSDNMPLGPLYGIYGALTHPKESERLSLIEALRCYTIYSAQSLGLDSFGLEPNKLASFVVIEKNIFDLPPKEIPRASVKLYHKGVLVSAGSAKLL